MANTERKFITGSSYIGQYDEIRGHMSGFGTYYYPDGSTYRGHFLNGQFHGYGRLQLTSPYNFTFIGYFENNVLMGIEDMRFEDGLRVNGMFDGKELYLSEWTYCEGSDRRYSTEMAEGPAAVGEMSRITNAIPTRDIRRGGYDVEEGIYLPSSGFILNIPRPFSRQRFVGCIEEVNFIHEHCRKAKNRNELLYTNEKAHSIINNNLTSNQKYYKPLDCLCKFKMPELKMIVKPTDVDANVDEDVDVDNEVNGALETADDSIKVDEKVSSDSCNVETGTSTYRFLDEFQDEYEEYEDENMAESESNISEDWYESTSSSCHQKCSQETQTVKNAYDSDSFGPINTSSSISTKSFSIDDLIEDVQRQFAVDWYELKNKEQVQDVPSDFIIPDLVVTQPTSKLGSDPASINSRNSKNSSMSEHLDLAD